MRINITKPRERRQWYRFSHGWKVVCRVPDLRVNEQITRQWHTQQVFRGEARVPEQV
ncbi:hypothetical protein [Streptomyces sp. NPDC059479]|uniref:hypothetical protein n=1 Tax=Streptomyces sp. NPDC059479 TaxID=3346848 RepID=UPI003692369F